MSRLLIYCIIMVLLSPACAPAKASGSRVVVKPKTHNRFFVKKNDRYKKRTKLVRMKS